MVNSTDKFQSAGQLAGSMNGKVCLVTGATAGIGRVTAARLAEQGATVVGVGRNADKCAQTAAGIRQHTGNRSVECMVADLSSLQAVRALALQFRDRYSRLDVLVNNVGAYFMSRRESVDGFEMTLALNHLGVFLLTNLLLDYLKASGPSRIVNVSSGAHRGARLDLNDLQNRKNYGIGWQAYARSKLANILFTHELARRLEGTAVTANALHPGFVATNFAANNGLVSRLIRPILNLASISAEEGAQTTLYLAMRPDLVNFNGKYFENRREVRSSEASYDELTERRLWDASAKMTGLA